MTITPYYERDGITLYVGDNRDVLPLLDGISAVVTDPPYGLSFMGKDWDHEVPGVAFWEAMREAMLPGSHLLSFGGTRTFHRIAVAIEDAGLELRDTLMWLYGSGFPKSHDVSKAIDKIKDRTKLAALSGEIRRARVESGLSLARIGEAMQAATEGRYGKWYHRGGHMFFETGMSLPSRPEWERLRRVLPIQDEFADVYDEAEREVLQERTMIQGGGNALEMRMGERREVDASITAPATPEAEQWQGWGTALKPAHEPIILARKPLAGTVAANVLQHGTGALNIDACRIPGDVPSKPQPDFRSVNGRATRLDAHCRNGQMSRATGRWPANVVLDEAAAEALDRQSGELASNSGKPFRRNADKLRNAYGAFAGAPAERGFYGDTGGASRFFYVAKASRKERGEGNNHPTVKPLALMRYLVTLVTPPGGVILDPFAGSGSTLVAAARLGINAIGIELSEEYAEIAARRIDHALNERPAIVQPALDMVAD